MAATRRWNIALHWGIVLTSGLLLSICEGSIISRLQLVHLGHWVDGGAELGPGGHLWEQKGRNISPNARNVAEAMVLA
jgi:hypothetical protein